ncbi:MAG: hypothetical protein K6U00_01945, partial [Armatimonadetes bacterium]|nr:hypothetical protein [Armatimonadota bacterium]
LTVRPWRRIHIANTAQVGKDYSTLTGKSQDTPSVLFEKKTQAAGLARSVGINIALCFTEIRRNIDAQDRIFRTFAE